MNAFQSCLNSSDVVPLYLPQQLYLKPIARLNISLQLPKRTMGKTISNWEVMEKLRVLIKPEEFTILKVTKTSLEVIRFEAEIDSRDNLQYTIERLHNKLIKLKEFTELMHVQAAEAKSDFPTKHTWDTFFRESDDMNEMKPGERPDTIHISNLPIKWFIPRHLNDDGDIKPSEKIFYHVFEKFGRIRYIDIPVCDPYRKKMKAHMTGMQTFSFDEKQFFEGYVQFRDYIGFTKAMDAFRNMKLLHKEGDKYVAIGINVDFDRTKHLSDASIRRREIVRERLIEKTKQKEERERKEREEKEIQAQLEREKEEKLKTEKEKRRQEREEKRKQKILAKLKINGADEINNKIAKEEKRLLKVQRKLEAIRLVEDLFRRIKNKREKHSATCYKSNLEKWDSELSKYKSAYESVVMQQRDKLHKAIEGRVILKSILGGGPRLRSYSTDSLSSKSSAEVSTVQDIQQQQQKEVPCSNYPNLDRTCSYQDWMRYHPPPDEAAYPNPYALAYYPPGMRPLPDCLPYSIQGRQIVNDLPGPSRGPLSYSKRGRGYNPRYRGLNRRRHFYVSPLEEDYMTYFQKFMNGHDNRIHSNYLKSISRSPGHRTYGSSHMSFKRRSSSYSKGRSVYSSRERSISRGTSSHRRSRSSRRRSNSRLRTRSYSGSSRYSRKSSVSRTSSYSRKSRSRSRNSRRFREKERRRGKERSRSRSKLGKRSSKSSSQGRHVVSSQSTMGSKTKSLSRSRSKERERRKSRSKSKSVDSSRFISPQRLRKMRSRSKSHSASKSIEKQL